MAVATRQEARPFDQELDEIRALVSQTGGLAEAAIREAVEALMEHNEAEAAKVIGADSRIDQHTQEIERLCIRLIALRAPMADDLRAVLASFQIAILVERIGDCARCIAEQVRLVPSHEYRPALRLLQSTAIAVRETVRCCLDAFASADGSSAASVCEKRDTIRALNEQLFRELLNIMTDNPKQISSSSCLLAASQSLERIGDHASDISKAVYFSTTGEHFSEKRNVGRSRPGLL